MLAKLVFSLLLAGCASSPVDYERSHGATHSLEFTDGGCSGTAVAPHVILTASHCFSGGELVSVSEKPAKIVKIVHDGHDHALVTVDLTFEQTAKLGPAPRVGAELYVWGNPRVFRDLLRIVHVAGTHDGATLIDGRLYFGDSGAAVFDSQGRIVGVVSAIYGEPAFYMVGMYTITFASLQ